MLRPVFILSVVLLIGSVQAEEAEPVEQQPVKCEIASDSSQAEKDEGCERESESVLGWGWEFLPILNLIIDLAL
ncbi:hypothetical protein DX883_02775 [Vibrio fluvialis]|nr:hypothetical protein [Vibrio fluvialis]